MIYKKIDEIIKEKTSDYELVAFLVYNKEGKAFYPIYLCIMQKSKYDNFFRVDNKEMEVSNNEQ